MAQIIFSPKTLQIAQRALETRKYRIFGLSFGPRRKLEALHLHTDKAGLNIDGFAVVDGKPMAISEPLWRALATQHVEDLEAGVVPRIAPRIADAMAVPKIQARKDASFMPQAFSEAHDIDEASDSVDGGTLQTGPVAQRVPSAAKAPVAQGLRAHVDNLALSHSISEQSDLTSSSDDFATASVTTHATSVGGADSTKSIYDLTPQEIDRDFAQYLRVMASPKAFAGSAELCAIAEMRGINIVVYNATGAGLMPLRAPEIFRPEQATTRTVILQLVNDHFTPIVDALPHNRPVYASDLARAQKEVPGDGSCLYYALNEAMRALAPSRARRGLSQQSVQQTATQKPQRRIDETQRNEAAILRAQTIAWQKQNAFTYKMTQIGLEQTMAHTCAVYHREDLERGAKKT